MKTASPDKWKDISPMTEQDMPQILMVDDDASICRLINRLLNAKGYECTIANDAGDARNEMKTQNFDLILCDVKMPGGSGIEVLQSIKKDRPDIKVIMFTNYPYPQYRKKCMDLGADFFFAKATEFEEIPKVIEQLLKNGSN